MSHLPPFPVILASLVMLATNSGCGRLSQFAYRCGDWLAPGTAQCLPAESAPPGFAPCESCARSGSPCGPQHHPFSGYSQVSGHPYDVAPTAHHAAAMTPDGIDVKDLQEQVYTLRKRMAEIQYTLGQRSQDAVETRSAYEATARRLEHLEREVEQWKAHMARLQNQMQIQDEQRIAQLQQLDRALAQLLLQYDTPPPPTP